MATLPNSFQVFYHDYENDVAISSINPESLGADRLVNLAEHLLVNEDNFLGVLDANDMLLQFYQEADGSIMVELLFPEASGSLQKKMSRKDVMALLAKLPKEFSEALLPNATYVG
jgi:hypothetical protein